MMYRLPALGALVLLALGVRVSAQFPEPAWPVSPATCPPHVRLDRAQMKEVDGRKDETLRRRPWPDKDGNIAHCPLVIENLRMHHFLNKKAIMINTGSPDKPRVDGQIASFTSVTFRNLDIGLVYRTQPGLHMDHIWIGAGHDEAIQPDVTFEDIFLHDGNKGVMPILFESGGNWGTLTLRRVAAVNVSHPVMIKLGKSSFKEIIIEDCPNLRVAFQGDGPPVTVRVRNCPGADIGCPRDEKGQRATQVTIVRESGLGTPEATKRHYAPEGADSPTTQSAS